MPTMYSTETNTLTVRDWMNVSKDMKLSAYDPTIGQDSDSPGAERPSAMFGTHIREAIAIVRDWKAAKK